MVGSANQPLTRHCEAQSDVATPWPFSALHGHSGHAEVWRQVFGGGLHQTVLAGPGYAYPVVEVRMRAPLELGQRFLTIPTDAEFVHDARKRVLPLRMLAPAASLEAGNQRGSMRLVDASPRAALIEMARDVRALTGWDFAQIPVPLDLVPDLSQAWQSAGLTVIFRPTGRTYTGHIGYAGWAGFLQSMSHNARKNLGRAERSAEAVGARIEVFGPQTLAAGLGHLQAMAALSWKAASDTRAPPVRVPLTARQLAFLRGLAGQKGIEPRIFALSRQDSCLGAALWFATGEWLTGAVTYFDPVARALSPGHTLMKAAFQWCEANGIRHLDMNATDDWLRAYTNVSAEFCTMIVLRRNLLGRAFERLARRAEAMPQDMA